MMKNRILMIIAVLVFGFSQAQTYTHSTRVRIKQTPEATATDTLIAITDDGTVVKTGIAVGDAGGSGGAAETLQETLEAGSVATYNSPTSITGTYNTFNGSLFSVQNTGAVARAISATNSAGLGLFASGSLGISATGTGAYGIYGESNSNGYGIYGRAYGNQGVGVYAMNTPSSPGFSGVPIRAENLSFDVESTMFEMMKKGANVGFDRTLIGAKIDTKLASSVYNDEFYASSLMTKWDENYDHASRVSRFDIDLVESGVAGNVLELLGTGNLKLSRYGVGDFVGSAVYGIGVDADGNLVETALGGGGGDTTLQQAINNSITADGFLYADTGSGSYFEDDGGALVIGASGTSLVAMKNDQTSLNFDNSSNVAYFADGRATPLGLQYNDDYSATFTERSLVDKGYVDASINNVYTADGTINTDRAVTLDTGSSLSITGDNSSLFVDSSNFGVEAQNWSLGPNGSGGSVYGGDATPVQIDGPYGFNLNIGSGGALPGNTVGQVLTTTGTAGQSAWADLPTFELVDDTTPQLGGQLDFNNNKINGLGDINITGTPTSPNSNSFKIGYALPSGAVKQVSNIQMTKSASNGSDVTFLQSLRYTTTSTSGESQIRGTHNDLTINGTGNIGEVTNTRNSITFNRGGTTDFLLSSSNNIALSGTVAGTVNYARSNGGSIIVDNPNVVVNYAQGGHPSIALTRGTVNEASVMFLDIDATTANVGSTLTLGGNVSFIQGGGGSDVATLKGQLTSAGHKGRFIWNQGTWESDFGGILNYTGTLASVEGATNKAVINKEYGDAHYQPKLIGYTVATLPAGTVGDTAYVTDATSPSYLGALTGGGSVVCPVFYNGTQWVSH